MQQALAGARDHVLLVSDQGTRLHAALRQCRTGVDGSVAAHIHAAGTGSHPSEVALHVLLRAGAALGDGRGTDVAGSVKTRGVGAAALDLYGVSQDTRRGHPIRRGHGPWDPVGGFAVGQGGKRFVLLDIYHVHQAFRAVPGTSGLAALAGAGAGGFHSAAAAVHNNTRSLAVGLDPDVLNGHGFRERDLGPAGAVIQGDQNGRGHGASASRMASHDDDTSPISELVDVRADTYISPRAAAVGREPRAQAIRDGEFVQSGAQRRDVAGADDESRRRGTGVEGGEGAGEGVPSTGAVEVEEAGDGGVGAAPVALGVVKRFGSGDTLPSTAAIERDPGFHDDVVVGICAVIHVQIRVRTTSAVVVVVFVFAVATIVATTITISAAVVITITPTITITITNSRRRRRQHLISHEEAGNAFDPSQIGSKSKIGAVHVRQRQREHRVVRPRRIHATGRA
mmetsp:Transcript_1217/g.1789  ORF Transcript_1217/g.1789 Transcript_1217/m.1789 type:complete len:454 (-) Transcript_1217:1285-2646(-)